MAVHTWTTSAVDAVLLGHSGAVPDFEPAQQEAYEVLAERLAGWQECFDCDNCYGVCPDNAVRKVGDHFKIDYDYRKGCGLCASECPARAIAVRPERR